MEVHRLNFFSFTMYSRKVEGQQRSLWIETSNFYILGCLCNIYYSTLIDPFWNQYSKNMSIHQTIFEIENCPIQNKQTNKQTNKNKKQGKTGLFSLDIASGDSDLFLGD